MTTIIPNPWDEPGAAKAIDNYWQSSQLEQEWYTKLNSILGYQLVAGDALEVGCGSGRVHEIIAVNHLYTGCDISTEMLELHRGNLPKSDLVLQTDPYKLPFDDGNFDNVICISVLQHMEHPELLIPELCRVTKKKLIVITWAHGLATKLIYDANGFHNNIYNVYSLLEILLKPKMGKETGRGHISQNNWLFCVSYEGK